MEAIKTTRYTEDEIDEVISDYMSRFGGDSTWGKEGRLKFIQVKGARIIYDYHDKQLTLEGDMGTANSYMGSVVLFVTLKGKGQNNPSLMCMNLNI